MKFWLVFLVTLVALSLVVDAQRSNNAQRRRNRLKNRGKGQNCHLKQIDDCLDKMKKLTNTTEPSNIIATKEGIDEICSTFDGVFTCIKAYIKKCSTPLHKELFDFATESITKQIDKFCTDEVTKKKLLEHTPCINEKVLKTNAYNNRCRNDFIAAAEKTQNEDILDDKLDIFCCGFNKWDECTNNMIAKECGASAVSNMRNFLTKAVGGITTMVCPKKLFNHKAQNCLAVLPKPGTKPNWKFLDNPVGKYFSSYFAFLLNINKN